MLNRIRERDIVGMESDCMPDFAKESRSHPTLLSFHEWNPYTVFHSTPSREYFHESSASIDVDAQSLESGKAFRGDATSSCRRLLLAPGLTLASGRLGDAEDPFEGRQRRRGSRGRGGRRSRRGLGRGQRGGIGHSTP